MFEVCYWSYFNNTILGQSCHCLFRKSKKLRHSLGRPSRSDFVQFEVDTNPPQYARFEHKYRLLPAPYEINLYDASSLFAGKIHAVICRAWKHRVKGRDLYDYVFYLSRQIPVNLIHLRERLLQSRYITEDVQCSLDEVKQMLQEKFESIDYQQAKSDVEPFIHDTSSLDLWCADFFKQISENLTSL